MSRHCWKGRAEWAEETYGWMSAEHMRCWLHEPSATCMLSHGHAGEHVFIPDAQIGVSFKKEGDRCAKK